MRTSWRSCAVVFVLYGFTVLKFDFEPILGPRGAADILMFLGVAPMMDRDPDDPAGSVLGGPREPLYSTTSST